MIFTRIRVGKLSNPRQWGKNPCVFFPCLTQPLSLKNGWWWLRQLICFGSGVAGLSIHAYMHTPPRLTSQWPKPLPSLTQTSVLSTPVLNTPALPTRVYPLFCSSTHKWEFLSILTQGSLAVVAHAQERSWCYPHRFSSVDLQVVRPYPFLTGCVVGSALLPYA